MLEITIITGLFNAGLITIGNKTGYIERLQVWSPSQTLNQLFSCEFCMGFWLAMAEILVYMLYYQPTYDYFFLPLAAAVITKHTV